MQLRLTARIGAALVPDGDALVAGYEDEWDEVGGVHCEGAVEAVWAG